MKTKDIWKDAPEEPKFDYLDWFLGTGGYKQSEYQNKLQKYYLQHKYAIERQSMEEAGINPLYGLSQFGSSQSPTNQAQGIDGSGVVGQFLQMFGMMALMAIFK